jgi:homoserine dehydrogenase
VARVLLERAAALAQQVGQPLQLRHVLVRQPYRPRAVAVLEGLLTTDPQEVIDDPDVGIVIEAWGDAGSAYLYIKEALANGKDVVTANSDGKAWAEVRGGLSAMVALGMTSVGGGIRSLPST